MTSLLLNDKLALDAGCLTRALPVERQAAIRTLVLSHSHMDHIASLPFFVENVYGLIEGAIDIYAEAPTIAAVRAHLFNNATWPDFTLLPDANLPSIRFHELTAEVPVTLEGIELTPIRVNHPVPTLGFLLRDAAGSVLWSSDTGPTRRIWEVANAAADLRAVCIDTSFENALQHIADASLHLTPRTLEGELRKLERRVPVLLHHLKPPVARQIREEVRQLRRSDLAYLEQGERYDFS